MVSSIEIEVGDVKMSPQTADVSIPFPINPTCAGSCPDPPPFDRN